MNCKVKWVLGFMVFCAAGLVVGNIIPEATGGRIAMVVIGAFGCTVVFIAAVNWLGIFRNPYLGAQEIKRKARKVAADKGIDLNTAIDEVWAEAKAKGTITPKVALESLPRPVLVDKAHMQHIRGSERKETMPLAGYNVPAQKPGLPAPLTWNDMATAWQNDQVNKAMEDKEL